MLEEGSGEGMLNRILGGGVLDKHGKYGKRRCRRERKYMEGKGRGMWESTLEEGPEAAGMLKGFWEGKCGTNGN